MRKSVVSVGIIGTQPIQIMKKNFFCDKAETDT